MAPHRLRSRTLLVGTALAALATAGVLPATGSAAPPADVVGDPSRELVSHPREQKGFFDARQPSSAELLARAGRIPARTAAAAEALRRSLGTQGIVSIDPLTGTPRQVARLDGYLTPSSSRSASDVVRSYLHAHRDLFGLDRSALTSLRLRRDYVDNLGTHHLSWQHVVDGIPVFGNGLKAHVARDGRLIAIQGSPLRTAPKVGSAPQLSAATARGKAARDVGGRAVQAVRKSRDDARRTTTWSNDDRASLAIFVTRAGARLGWSTVVHASNGTAYQHVVDATNGRVLYRADLVARDSGDALVYDNYPGAPHGGTQRDANFVEEGWLSPRATRLFGRFAFVWSDVNDDEQPQSSEMVPAPRGDTPKWPLVTFDSSPLCDALHLCSWDPNVPFSWRENRKQDGTQAFYFVSNFHDHLLAAPIAFTRAAGNFDLLDGDPVLVHTLDGASLVNGLPDLNHINNANMSTPPDGTPPRMQMFLFNSPEFSDEDEPVVSASGANDATLVYHEYGHGLSNRLVVDVNGNSTLFTPHGGSMGEAWSDFYAFDYTEEQGFEPDTATPGELLLAKYEFHDQPLGRFEGVDCAVGDPAEFCPGGIGGAGTGGFTFGDFGTVFVGPEVHSDGEIWVQTLWDLRGRIGIDETRMVVTRAMELGPDFPTFLDMRNAILQADLVAFAGAHQATIWEVFANRGMGWFSAAIDAGDVEPAEDFNLVPAPGSPTGDVTGTITDPGTGAPVVDAVVAISGHDSGFGGDYLATTDANGNYTIEDVFVGTYPKVAVAAAGYEFKVEPVVVDSPTTTHDFSLRRNWASEAGGGEINSFNGPDYTDFGCGPAHAIDDLQGSGWGSDTGVDAIPTNVVIPKFIVVELPEAVDVTLFEVDPSNICGDPGSASTGPFRIETSTDGTTYTVAAEGEFGVADRGRYNEVVPGAGTDDVRFVKFWILGPQVPDFATTCPDGPFAGCQFMDLTELRVFGTPAA